MNTIRPVETKTAQVAKDIEKIIKQRATRYKYLRPDGANIEEYANIVQKPAYTYRKESEPIHHGDLKAKETIGQYIDFYVG